MTEIYEEAEKLGVPDICITAEEWRKEYANAYNILALDGSEMDKIFAAQDIIKIYLLLQARQAAQQSAQRTCAICGNSGDGHYLQNHLFIPAT